MRIVPLALLFMASCSCSSMKTGDIPEKAASYQEIGIDDLISQWKKNPLAAVEKFSKGVSFTGEVSEIRKLRSDLVILEVSGKNDYVRVECYDDKLDATKKLSLKQKVKIVGRSDPSDTLVTSVTKIVADGITPVK